MTGRRRTHWRDANDSEQVGMVENRSWDYVESFEDETIARMDFKRELRLILAFLPRAEKVSLVRMLVGLPPLDHAEERALRRARKRMSERGRKGF